MTPRIWLLDGDTRPSYYRELRAALDAQWLAGPSALPLDEARAGVDLAVASGEFNNFQSALIGELVRRQVPLLHVPDGVVEWRNTWEHPRSRDEQAGMPLFQPLLCHKIACQGRSSARLFESWGNVGKCEIVGAPRLDGLLGRKPRARREGEPFRILVATARTPAFTPEQRENVKLGLADLKAAFERRVPIGTTRVEPLWRVTGGLAEELALPTGPPELAGRELNDVLEHVDAAISTPSTALLHAMLHGVPVALLDYGNAPRYLLAAWTISAPRHIEPVWQELASPPPAKLLYQDTVLHDALECRTPAAPRLARLAQEMIRLGRSCREAGRPLEFPLRILAESGDGFHLPEERFDWKTLYPRHPVFQDMDRAARQAELGHLRGLSRECQQLHAQREQWRKNYERLAGTFPVNLLLWLRRRLLKIPDPPRGSGP